MAFFATLSKMLIILFAVSMGWLANRLGYFNKDTDRRLTKVVLNITLPAMMLSSVLSGEQPSRETVLAVFAAALLLYGVEAVFALVVPRLLGGSPKRRGVWSYALMFPNMSFIGFPVVEALFGSSAVFYAMVILMPQNVLSFIIGPTMLGGQSKFNWKSLCTPCLISSVIALGIALSGFRMPFALPGDMLGLVGDVTVPLSLLVLGSMLAGLPVKKGLRSAKLWIFAAVRLVVLPVMLYLILRPMGMDAVVMGVAVTEMSMPVSVNAAMLCIEYEGDIECMAQLVFLTTLLAMVSIPLVGLLL